MRVFRSVCLLCLVVFVCSLSLLAQTPGPQCTLTVDPTSGPAPLTVTANGSCTEPGIAVFTTLDWGDGTPPQQGSSGTHTYTNSGTYTVTLTGTDDAGRMGTATQTVTVTNQPPMCTLSVKPNSGTAPLNVTATGNCTDPNNNIVTTQLDWGDGTVDQGVTSGSHTYNNPGTYTVTVSALDSNEASGSASQTVTVIASQPPTCMLSVNPSSGTEPLTVTATGDCTDPNNDITSTQLDWGDGTVQQGVTSGTHTYTKAGTYTVTVSAIDSTQQTGSASQRVVVSANQPPTCTLTVNPNSGDAPLTVTATGNCTDPDNDIQSRSLNWGDGTVQQGVTSGTHTYNTPGTYTVTVSATDSVQQTGTATQTVTVTQANRPPTCTLSVSPNNGNAPLTVTATGSCTDPDQNLASTTLDWGDGTVQQDTASGTHTYNTPGNYTVTLTGTDSQGATGTATQSITVGQANRPPTCTLSVNPNTGTAPLTVTATGSCTDPDQNLSSTTLDWGDGTTQATPSGTHTYTTNGTYTVTLTGTDSAGLKSTATASVSVAVNPPPTCTLTVTPQSGIAPLNVTANGNCTDPNDDIVSTSIYWGDDTSTDGSTGTHTFNFPGSYSVTITAIDAAQQETNATVVVNVTTLPPVFLGVGSGHIIAVNPDGSVAETFDTGAGGTITGLMFDRDGALFSTDFTAGRVSMFGGFGAGAAQLIVNGRSGPPPATDFGSGYDCQPESITQDDDGNVYVGLAGCKKNVLKFDSSGALKATYTVAIEDQGADWIDISADKCTLFYSSEGTGILRYNVCGNRQMSDFASGFHKALSLRLLPDGGVIVADNVDIHRTDVSGKIIKTYDAPGADCWVALNLDPDGTSFWSADSCTSKVYHFDLASGSVLDTLTVNVPANSIFGLAVGGQTFSSPGSLNASPGTMTVNSGGSATFDVAIGNFSGAKTTQINGTSSTPIMLALSCSNLPTGALCSFNPPVISSNGGTSKLTITTNNTQVVAYAPTTSPFNLLAYAAPFALGFVLIAGRKPRRRVALLCVLMLALMVVLFACGTTNITNNNNGAGAVGAPLPGVTPPGNYTINVNAGNGALQSSTSVNLTVK